MKSEGIPLGRKERSADIIAGVDFLSVFMRNAEERYYPMETKPTLPYEAIDHVYQETTTRTRPKFSVSTTKPTTTTTAPTTTKKPKLIVPTLPTMRKTEPPPSSEASTNIELRTAPPPITNHEVFKYIKSKSTKEKIQKFRKEDTFTEISVVIATEKSHQSNSQNSVSIIEPSAIISHSNKEEFTIDEDEPLTIEATELNEKILSNNEEELINPEINNKEHARVNREEQSSYQYDFSSRLGPNKARSISYSAVIQVPYHETKDITMNTPGEDLSQDYDYKDNDNDDKRNQSVAETQDYYVTSTYNNNKNINKNIWNEKKEEEQHKLYHTTERVWGTTEKNWGMQQTTPKVWGTTEKNWGVQQTTPKVWGTTEKNWGIPQAITPKVWGATEKNWGVQQPFTQTTPKIWGTTEKNWGLPENQYPQNQQQNGLYNPQHNYEGEEDGGLSRSKSKGDKPLQFQVGIPPAKPTDHHKVGYVVEGRNYRKYRVEERTSDGFIVGEYGVVSNNDGSLRGVRYTADGTINPSVIYDALMKFLSL